MIAGQAARVAAAQAVKAKVTEQAIDVPILQKRLRELRQIIDWKETAAPAAR